MATLDPAFVDEAAAPISLRDTRTTPSVAGTGPTYPSGVAASIAEALETRKVGQAGSRAPAKIA